MKVGIISDSHDNAPNLKKALAWMRKNKVEQIIHCGDLCAASFLEKILAPKFFGKIHLVFGNVEDQESVSAKARKFFHVAHYGDVGEIKIKNKKIAFTHYPQKAEKLAKSGKYDFVFYGHTHKPWSSFVKITDDKEKKDKKVMLVNPGTLAGLFQKATFAVWDADNGELELKLVEKL